MGIPVISELVQYNNGDFALLDDNRIRGGFRIVNTLTDRNAISQDMRKQGMTVFVISTDIVYALQADLISWAVDSSSTSTLQSAFNAGTQITTSAGSPLSIQGSDASIIFEILDETGINLLSIDGNGNLDVAKTLTSAEYTTSLTCVAATNSQNVIIDTTDITQYRAVQYFYTCSNSDNSGFETGQVFLVHNGLTVSICAMMNSSIGTPCGLTFGAGISGTTMQLLVTTDYSGLFSRVLRLFKVVLP